jgi:ESS family glutamate:Na+ symporter
VKELKKGGRAVFIFLVACSVLLVIQATVGALVAHAMGEPALFGVLTGNVALAGGPGTALSFAKVFEEAGVRQAATAGLSAAMLGVILGGFLGGPVSTFLIRKNNLRPAESTQETQAGTDSESIVDAAHLGNDLVYNAAWILVMGSAGYYLSKEIEAAGIKLPFYIGSMIVAAVVRNIEDQTHRFKINGAYIDAIGGTSLTLFIAVSMMTLQLWTVAAVAGPLLVNLAVQAVIICVIALTVMFYIGGKDYDAAVISGGMIGFMLGTTANALATMKAVTEKFGPAPRAFLVVPLVGACFIDFINAITISIALNFFR